jgi:hypothetical protein
LLTLIMTVPAIVAGTGCYQYRDARLTDLRPDATVHVVLSSDASAALAPAIGPNATSIDGRVLSVDTRSMRLAATQIARVVGPEEFLRNEAIDVPAGGTLAISMRSVDRFRTVLAIGAIVASAFVAHSLSDQPGVVSVKTGPSAGSK